MATKATKAKPTVKANARPAGKPKPAGRPEAAPKGKAAVAATKTSTKAAPKPKKDSRYTRSARAIIQADKPLTDAELATRSDISKASVAYCREAFFANAAAMMEVGWLNEKGIKALAGLQAKPAAAADPQKAPEPAAA